MQITTRFAFVFLAALAVSTGTASAQFDDSWLAFEKDGTRIRNPDGSVALHVIADPEEKDMAWGDLDRDGWIDLVIVRKQPTSTYGAFPNYLLMNEGGRLVDRTAQYASAADVPGDLGFLTPTNDRDVELVDVDNDGWLDVVTATTRSFGLPKHLSHPRVYKNLGSAGGAWLGLLFENDRIPTFPLWPNFCDVDAGDVTGDGFVDLYFANYDGEGAELFDRLLVNDGTGRFTDSNFTRLTQTMLDCRFGTAVRLVDMNLDGTLDIVRCSGVTGTGVGSAITVAYNSPGALGHFPTFMYQAQVGSLGTYHVDVGDLNNDARPDMIISDRNNDGFRLNVGTDALGRVIWGPLRGYGYVTGADDGIAGSNLLVDLDGDGWKDAIHSDFDVDVLGCHRRCHIYHNRTGLPGGEIVMQEEAGSASHPWRGAVGFGAGDLTGTYDVAAFDIDNDGDTDLVLGRCSGTYVWMNQKNRWTPSVAYCSGDGSSVACPCGFAGAAEHGCPSSMSWLGAKLAGTGVASVSADSLLLTTTLVENGAALCYQGHAATDIVFGDGKLCAGAGIIRLGVTFGNLGTCFFPCASAPAPLHAAGLVQSGDQRAYQVWYRDAAPYCTSATYNLTNGVRVVWAP